MQLSYAQIPRRRVNLMDIKDTFRFVAPRVHDAAVKTAAQLNHLGIRYALAGGLAVGAHGYIRATTYVDFLVGEEAFDRQGVLVAFKAVVPIEALIYMKLVAKRRKDLVDVVELVKAGADLTIVREYLRQYAGGLVPLFEELVNEALTERQRASRAVRRHLKWLNVIQYG